MSSPSDDSGGAGTHRREVECAPKETLMKRQAVRQFEEVENPEIRKRMIFDEKETKEYLDKDIIRNGWDKIIMQVFLPVEKVYKVLNGKKVMRERNFYPGYIMIEVADGKLSDEIIQHLSNISNVMHFLTDGKGSKGNIISLRKAEVNKMLGKVDEMADAGGMKMSEPFIVGETIKIIDGPFNDFNGVIEEVTDEKKKLKVQVKIFGRATPVELSYMQVEKIS